MLVAKESLIFYISFFHMSSAPPGAAYSSSKAPWWRFFFGNNRLFFNVLIFVYLSNFKNIYEFFIIFGPTLLPLCRRFIVTAKISKANFF